MARSAADIKKLGHVLFTTFEAEEAVRHELLAAAEESGELEAIAIELHGFLALYCEYGLKEAALDVYHTMQDFASQESISYWDAAQHLYEVALYEQALQAIHRASADLVDSAFLQEGTHELSAARFMDYLALELALESELSPSSPRVAELDKLFDVCIDRRCLNATYLYASAAARARSLSVNARLHKIIHALIADFEMIMALNIDRTAAAKIEHLKHMLASADDLAP